MSDTSTWRVRNLELGLEEPEAVLRQRAAEVLGIEPELISRLTLARKSVDARRRRGLRSLRFIVHVDVGLRRRIRGATFQKAVRSGRVVATPETEPFELPHARSRAETGRVVVVGSGPAGLFAALRLAINGAAVTLIDRGASLEERGRDLVRFRRTRKPNPESNLLFGEGGAGTYSDGKLYTRVDHPLEQACLEALVEAGANPDILYDSRAHIGTDRLHRILPALRDRMQRLGVEFHWRTRMNRLLLDESGSRVCALDTNRGEIPCDALFLAPGHSALDTIRALAEQGVHVEAKPFQLGVRIEHPQELITAGRYGTGPEAASLGPASYNLVAKNPQGPASAYSFCMCPGGKIVASVNVAGTLCTNGMSNSMHSSPWANAALVTTFGPDEFGEGPFAGVEFQQQLERKFFDAGGGDYTAPAQTAKDFLARRLTPNPRHSSYSFGTAPGRIDRLLPRRALDAISGALNHFERLIPGYSGPEGLLVGLESRSSCPFRLVRAKDSRLATGFSNLYPIGEGAGYAGGIMSAALDGAASVGAFLGSGEQER